jgi:endonuclease-3
LGIIAALEVLGVISEAEAKKHRAPGLERAVPKAKGMEFASVLQQFGADFYVAPSGDKVKAVVSEVDPAALDRLPQHSLHEEAATRRAEHALNAVPPGDKGRGTPEQPLVATSASDAGPPATAPKRRRRKSEAAEADQAADAEAPADAAGEEPNPASPPGSSPTKQLIRKKPR